MEPRHVLVFVIVAIGGNTLSAFIPLALPYLLTEHLHVAREMQGRVIGGLSVAQNVTMGCLILVSGALTDRYGRRRLITAALLGLAATAVLYPLAPTISALAGLAVLLGMSQSAQTAGAATTTIDYPAEAARGRFIAFLLVTQSISGALVVGRLGASLPQWFVHHGLSPVDAGRWAYWAIAGIGAACAVLAARGLAGRARARAASSSKHTGLAALLADLRAVLAAARERPHLRFVLIVAVIMRGDFSVVSTFLSLWVIGAAAARRIPTAEALQHSGFLYSVLMVANFVSPPLIGFLADRMSRVKLLTLVVCFTGSSFLTPMLVPDPFTAWAALAVAFIGLAEGAVITATQALFGQETPASLRGTAMGVFAFLGICGVTIINLVSGFLYDALGRSAPFALIGLCNLAILLVAVLDRRRQQRKLAFARSPGPTLEAGEPHAG